VRTHRRLSGRALAAVAAATLLGASGTAPAAGAPPFFSVYKDTAVDFDWWHDIARTRVSGVTRALAEDVRLAGASTVTLAFANGECGDETWTGAAGEAVARANRPLFVAANVRYVISTGGQGGLFTCGTATGMQAFLARWDSPQLAGLDYDIEEAQTPAQVDDLVRRAAEVHASHPSLRVSFTIATEAPNAGAPVAVEGLGRGLGLQDPYDPLGDVGHRVMDSIARLLGWDGTPSTWPSYVTINLMTMDYATKPAKAYCVVKQGLCRMGESAVQAAYDLRSAWNVPPANTELTSMIGRNDAFDEQFTLADVDRVTAFAIAQGLAGVHTWSWDRDAPCKVQKASDTCNSMGRDTARYGYLHRHLADGLK
jgi:hypothetical protein